MLIMGLFILIFFIAAAYQYEFYDEVKRLTSFAIFMSMFSYMFIKIDKEMIESFKISIVGVGLCFSVISIFTFFTLSIADMGAAKDLVGGQRFGFVYLLGIWLTYYYQCNNKLYEVIKYSVLIMLLLGLLLTFSRASIVGLFGSIVFFMLDNFSRWLRRPNFRLFARSLAATVFVGITIVLLYMLVPDVFTFFDTRLFSFLFDSGAVASNLADSETSEGTRVYILAKVFDFLIHNPLTGSGYLGVWIFSDALFGSAHNQYADVLFRTGVFGFIAYIYLLFLFLKYSYTNEKALFWGLLSILCYGMFHETFKESQGGFVLAFLMGMMSQSLGIIENKPSVVST